MPEQDWTEINKRRAVWRKNTTLEKRARSKRTANPTGQSPAGLRKRRYGITEEQYQQMLADQGNACAICRTPFEGIKVCVDHCHDTKKVRGLLCDGCNVGLGRFKDSPNLLQRAVDYLATGCKKGH
jgi:hypothetical protein